MTERVEVGQAVLYHGDALDVMRELESESCAMMLTDPPYSSGGMFRGDRLQDVHTKYVNSDTEWGGAALPAFSGDTRDQFGYWFWVAVWINQARRVMVPGGIGALFSDWRQLPTTVGGLQAGGFVWRGIVPWYKPNGRPTQGRWANQCEYVAWGTNGPRTLAGHAFPGFYEATAPSSKEREHMTEKPIAILEDMLEVVERGGVVLDPFMGSGTTGIACALRGRRFIGVELERQYFDIACRRIEDAHRQGAIFEAPKEPVQADILAP